MKCTELSKTVFSKEEYQDSGSDSNIEFSDDEGGNSSAEEADPVPNKKRRSDHEKYGGKLRKVKAEKKPDAEEKPDKYKKGDFVFFKIFGFPYWPSEVEREEEEKCGTYSQVCISLAVLHSSLCN